MRSFFIFFLVVRGLITGVAVAGGLPAAGAAALCAAERRRFAAAARRLEDWRRERIEVVGLR